MDTVSRAWLASAKEDGDLSPYFAAKAGVSMADLVQAGLVADLSGPAHTEFKITQAGRSALAQ